MDPDEVIPSPTKRIVLVGFMGAGKSTVGPILARALGWRFIDADHHLQQKTGDTVAELFLNYGEARFRQMEAEVFADLHREHNLVLALGGGAVEAESTRSLLAQSHDTCVVFLKAPLEILVERCENQPGSAVRPVLQQREELSARFQARQQYYERAHVTVNTESVPPGEVADLVLKRLSESAFAIPMTQRAAII
jgi:shikimate kinase